jgi:nucleotide-binding universal stress UspA family protein
MYCALAEDVGVVVVGRTGIRGAKDPLGPYTRELIRRCPRPVLVCGTRTTPMERVLVAYGGGPASEGALAFATRFASITGAHLDVVHVNRDAEEGARAIARASGALSLAMLSFDLHSVEGDLEQGIGEAVERFGADTVFAGATKEGEAWLVPSHTEAILRATDIPVLVHMPPVPAGILAPSPIAILHLMRVVLQRARIARDAAARWPDRGPPGGSIQRRFDIRRPTPPPQSQAALAGAIAETRRFCRGRAAAESAMCPTRSNFGGRGRCSLARSRLEAQRRGDCNLELWRVCWWIPPPASRRGPGCGASGT